MTTTPPPNSTLGPTGIAFGLGMALIGLVVGYMIGTTQSSGPTSSELSAQIDKAVEQKLAAGAPKGTVVNNTGGDLRRLSDKEKQELLAKKKADAAPLAAAAPLDSPFLTAGIVAGFEDDKVASDYRSAVTLMAAGNARKARPLLNSLHSKAEGQPWKEQVGVLLADAKISVGDVDDGRRVLNEWKSAYPKSEFMPVAVVTEGKAFMKDGKRVGSGKKEITTAQRRAYDEAITLFEKAEGTWPGNPALEEALLNKAALLGELDRLEEAEAAAVSLVDLFPNAKRAPRALFNVAKRAFDTEDFPRAERMYKRLISDFPRDRLSQSANSNLAALKILGKPAPELDLEEWLGDDLGSMNSMKGKPVLLVFWATWCPHCKKAMPAIDADLWGKYKDQGLQVVAVTKNSKGQTTEKVRSYLDENGYTVPVAIDGGSTSRSYGVSGIPAAALVDKEGKVVFRNHPAQVTGELIEKYL
jgi:outer membrane protein assembly factor BamD (BamD/ComL family)/peroxiredoxin